MPTTLPPSSPFATMTASQVLAEQERLLATWTAQDAERAARHVALLASFE